MKKTTFIAIGASLAVIAYVFIIPLFPFVSLKPVPANKPEVSVLEPVLEPKENTISIKPIPAATTSATSTSQPAVIPKEITANNIFRAVNQVRVKAGLLALKENSRLDQAAQAHLYEILSTGEFSHSNYAEIAAQEGYNYLFLGENLASMGINQTTEDTIKAWVASPLHYQNILGPTYTETGIAVEKGLPCIDANNQKTICILVVQMFGKSY